MSFDEVMDELDVDQDDLKKMVSEGELRAYRSDNEMKFSEEEVEKLKAGTESGEEEMIDLDDVEEEIEEEEDLDLEDFDVDEAEEEEVGGATEEIIFEEDDLDLDEEEEDEFAADETFVEDDLESEDTIAVDEDEPQELETGSPGSQHGQQPGRSRQTSTAAAGGAARSSGSNAMLINIVLVVGILISFFSVYTMVDNARIASNPGPGQVVEPIQSPALMESIVGPFWNEEEQLDLQPPEVGSSNGSSGNRDPQMQDNQGE